MAERTASFDGARSHSQSESPVDDGFFNDISRRPSAPNENQPKSKRMACVLCRRRKLKCDGARPACATCARLSHDCVYDEIRKKSGPKRGYVKALEARLAQVETILKTQDPNRPSGSDGNNDSANNTDPFPELNNMSDNMDVTNLDESLDWAKGLPDVLNGTTDDFGSIMTNLQTDTSGADPFQNSWGGLIGLDMEEALPSQDVIDELNELYFTKIHLTMPFIHRPRYLMSMAMSTPKLRPPLALQYIIWAYAASISEKYHHVNRHFYERARYYYERDEMRGHGEDIVSLRHLQALLLVSSYEFNCLMLSRAWHSTGRAARLSLMLGLNKVDGSAVEVKMCLPPPKDNIEKEERRRAFWVAFQGDRYASIGTGWPMTLDEIDITTNLPCNEDAFEQGIAEPTISMDEALKPGGSARLSPMGAVTVLACIFGRNLLHLHRPTANEDEHNLNGEFWRRHGELDNILLSTAIALPEHMRMPQGIQSPNLIFMNMCLHTATICLHQAAIFKAEKHRTLAKISAESKIRCITAAAEISNIMKLCSHMDMAGLNPFTCFCLYVSSRVFVQYLKSRPTDGQIKSSLFFMLTAMYMLKKRHPLAESFLVQLDVDLEAAGLDDLRNLSSEATTACWNPKCDPIKDTPQGKIRRNMHGTYGDGGIGKHSDPQLPNHGESPDSTLHSDTIFSGIVPTNPLNRRGCGAGSRPMAMRQKAPSTGLSPLAMSPDMEISGNSSSNPGSNGPTPPSLHDGSSTFSSITSITPPSGIMEDPINIFNSQNSDQMQYRPGVFTNNSNDSAFGGNHDSFDFSTTGSGGGYDFTQSNQMHEQQQQQQNSNFMHQTAKMTTMQSTAGNQNNNSNVADLGNMTEEEFNSMMNGVAGWDTVVTDGGGSGGGDTYAFRMMG